jgi:methionyl-tRNA synthetase
VPFDRDTEVSWDSLTRRYNADLANDYGNLLNRTLSMTARYVDGQRLEAAMDGELARQWPGVFARYGAAIEGCLLHDALGALWEFVGAANRYVDAQQPWALARNAKAGDEAAATQLRHVLSELLEANRVLALAVGPFMPSAARRAAAQLGAEFPYDDHGNGGPALAELVLWGRGPVGGSIGTPEPLFPRLENAPAE